MSPLSRPSLVLQLPCLPFLRLQGYNIISVLSLEIVPIMELLASMKSHSVPEDINVSAAHASTNSCFRTTSEQQNVKGRIRVFNVSVEALGKRRGG